MYYVHVNPNTLSGPELEKFGRTYYNGTVVRVDRVSGQCHISYNDDDSESLSEGEMRKYVIQ